MALEVLIDGISIGVLVPPSGRVFAASVCNGDGPHEALMARVTGKVV